MQRGLKIVIWTICVVHLLSRLIVYCYQKVNYQGFDYETVHAGLKILKHRMTQAIILHCLIMVILINGYGDENDSDLYVPARNRKISKMIASVTNKTYTKIIQKLEQWGHRHANTREWRRRQQIATRHAHKVTKQRRGSYVKAFTVTALAMQAQQHGERTVQFDTDSAPVGVDNRCTGCISHVAEDFVGPLQECQRTIKGFGGTRTTNVQIGTLRWQWQDDQGMTHTFLIPKSFYVPEGKCRLLSPQHWAQTQKDYRPIQGTISETDAHRVILKWKQRQHHLTIPLGHKDNVATFYLAPGFNRYA